MSDKPILKDNGGVTFPMQPFRKPNGDFDWGQEGITLRDYFAAAALMGIIAGNASKNIDFISKSLTAKDVYEMADAMLIERKS